MADTLNYKCPNCSAGLTFDSKSQKMKCEYCGRTYSLDELDKIAEQEEEVKEVKGITGKDLSRSSGSQTRNPIWLSGAARPAARRSLQKRRQVRLCVLIATIQ